MPRGRILVVDRNPDFLQKTREILIPVGYEMIVDQDPERALATVPMRGVDGVIAHSSLNTIDGLELCRRLRAQDDRVPCYLMVPHDDDELIEQCFEAGARNVLVRPLKRTELLFAARSLMNLRSLLRAGGVADAAGPGAARGPTPARRVRTAPPPPPGAQAERASFFHFELWRRMLSIELKRAKRYDFPLSVLLVSPDPGGAAEATTTDAASSFGHAVQSAIRDIDLPMHFADDTVMIVMPHTDADGARVVAERLRRKARQTADELTVSVGLTSMSGRSSPSYSQLVARASKALAEAKKGGGNTVVTV
jgi:diguanylate cyclase (GGDEF)-like protein